MVKKSDEDVLRRFGMAISGKADGEEICKPGIHTCSTINTTGRRARYHFKREIRKRIYII